MIIHMIYLLWVTIRIKVTSKNSSKMKIYYDSCTIMIKHSLILAMSSHTSHHASHTSRLYHTIHLQAGFQIEGFDNIEFGHWSTSTSTCMDAFWTTWCVQYVDESGLYVRSWWPVYAFLSGYLNLIRLHSKEKKYVWSVLCEVCR